MSPAFKLEIELVPSTSWYNNLRKALPRSKWDALRNEVFAAYGQRCGICCARTRLQCHERWSYDEARGVQRLEGFIALCALCHHVKHIGLAQLLADKGHLDFERVIRHFMYVNNCDRAAYEQHLKEAFALWAERSKREWALELAPGAFPIEPAPGGSRPRAGHRVPDASRPPPG